MVDFDPLNILHTTCAWSLQITLYYVVFFGYIFIYLSTFPLDFAKLAMQGGVSPFYGQQTEMSGVKYLLHTVA